MESIDDSVAAANDAFLSTAEDLLPTADEESSPLIEQEEASPQTEDEETSPLSEEEGAALSEFSLDGDFDPAPEVAPSPVLVPGALISTAWVSKALLKVAMARTREDALVKANGLLADEGVEIHGDSDGSLSVRCGAAAHDLADVNALASLPASFEPLRPLLKQIFRLRAVG